MRVVIADDSTLLREGICQLLANSGIEVTASVGDVPSLLRAVDEDEPDLAIIDIRMPPTHTDEGLRAAMSLRHDRPQLAVLLLSQWVQAGQALDLFERGHGGLGYLLKDRVTDVDDFLDAIRRVSRGGSAIDAEVVATLVHAGRAGDPVDALTNREREVLARMAEGRSNTAIAQQLHVSRKTVETHANSLFAKLGLEPGYDDNRRVLAVLTWLRAHE